MSESTPSPRIRYVADDSLIWRRVPHGKGFQWLNEHGKPVSTTDRERLEGLVIPPAWTEVRISPQANAHIQAIGYDARGRKQYIYHPKWVEQNQQHKFDKLVRFGEVLPPLRETVAGHMRQHELTRERVVATIVWLLEHTFIRVGNQQYAQENQSYGLTTLRNKHVSVEGNTVSFSFKGKSGVYHELDIRHPRVAKTIKQCIELPGYELFQYIDDQGQRQMVDSHDVNEYLQQVTGEELSAKDFRTWGGSTLAGARLFEQGSAESPTVVKKVLSTVVKDVSQHLRNTATVCRKYYIHPYIIESYEKNRLVPHFQKVYRWPHPSLGLAVEEEAMWSLVKSH